MTIKIDGVQKSTSWSRMKGADLYHLAGNPASLMTGGVLVANDQNQVGLTENQEFFTGKKSYDDEKQSERRDPRGREQHSEDRDPAFSGRETGAQPQERGERQVAEQRGDPQPGRSRKDLKPISIVEWAEKNDVDLSPVKHVFNGMVAAVNDLDTAIQNYHAAHFTTPPAGVVDTKAAEAKAIEEGRHTQYLDSLTEPGSVGTNDAQEFSAIEQASRNLRTQVQAFAAK